MQRRAQGVPDRRAAVGGPGGGEVDRGDGLGTSRRAVLRAAVVLPLAAACAAPQSGGRPSARAASTTTAAATTSAARPPTGEVDRATSGRPEVALTFHGAGDPDLARRVLGTLHDRGAAVTVLAVGTWLQQYPDAAGMVTDLGHELGNHTWSHRDIDAMDERDARVEIERCRDRIAAAIGGPGAFFRPSQAQHATPAVRALAAAAGYPTVLSYDVDSRDVTDPGSAAIRRNVAAATAGSVVSLHLGHPGTLAALPGLLDDLAGRGLTPVTATRLFG
ncbi:polysaccharide deacetylase family protein [Pseudonocardia halophobica]|uniref:polysaccharide deacetylase family protein n=1 Tax=Pseudonocardia halophobica TaxID=29401 RepID=UPI003D910E66